MKQVQIWNNLDRKWVFSMTMNYDKLWKLLIDKKMTKMDLVAKSEYLQIPLQTWERGWMFPQRYLGKSVKL